MNDLNPNPTESNLTAQQILNELGDRLQFRLVAGQGGLSRPIREKDLTRPGLALAGFFGNYRWDRIQVFGNTENEYLRGLPQTERAERIAKVFKLKLPLVVVTDNNTPLKEMLLAADLADVPVFTTSLSTTELSSMLVTALDEQFAPAMQTHGVLVDVYGVGVLVTGKARAGKSELALDLVERGHRLVADDIVEISKRMSGVLMGRAPELLRHLIEVRGLGILDVEKMFGVRAVRFQKRVEIVLELVNDPSEAEIERLGIELNETDFLGIKLPHVKLPVLPGKYLAVLAEIVALNYLLKLHGVNTAVDFSQRLSQEIERKRELRNYLKGDYE
ncbi:MAG: HPr(Ser) kinase/phosphatase [bacterium]|nr:HPr(Ser) kinase/phosphatase [bacterium]